ncbi:hypothetical protein KKE48_02455, partial [Patescibacteria group bacterium]|nr:hypothetical protein [Patescibacteria group bacterium]
KEARVKYKKLKENCFALLAEFRRVETLGRGFKSFERFSLEKGSSFVQQLRLRERKSPSSPEALRAPPPARSAEKPFLYSAESYRKKEGKKRKKF